MLHMQLPCRALLGVLQVCQAMKEPLLKNNKHTWTPQMIKPINKI